MPSAKDAQLLRDAQLLKDADLWAALFGSGNYAGVQKALTEGANPNSIHA